MRLNSGSEDTSHLEAIHRHNRSRSVNWVVEEHLYALKIG